MLMSIPDHTPSVAPPIAPAPALPDIDKSAAANDADIANAVVARRIFFMLFPRFVIWDPTTAIPMQEYSCDCAFKSYKASEFVPEWYRE